MWEEVHIPPEKADSPQQAAGGNPGRIPSIFLPTLICSSVPQFAATFAA